MRSILESDKPSIIKTVLANVADEEELEAGSNTKNSIKNLMESINEAEACKLCNTTCEIVAAGKPDAIGPIKEEEDDDDDDDHHDDNDDEDTDIDEIDDFCGIQIRNSSNTCRNKSKTAFDNITSTTDKAVNISTNKVNATEESESESVTTTTTKTTETIAATTSTTISTSNKAGGSKLGYNNIIASLLRTTTL